MTKKTALDYFNDGREAALSGLPANSCQLRFKAWPYECWQLGWQLGDIEGQTYNGYNEPEILPDNPKTPFEQGEVAFMRGLSSADGPYEPGSADAIDWQRGWRAGFAGLTQANRAPRARFSWRIIMWALGIAVLASALIAAFIYAPRVCANSSQAKCERTAPPWATVECRK